MEATFEDWIRSASIYVGYARYGQLGGRGFVIVACYNEPEETKIALEKAVHELDIESAYEGIAAGRVIRKADCWYANDPDPSIAMQKLMGKMRKFQRTLPNIAWADGGTINTGKED